MTTQEAFTKLVELYPTAIYWHCDESMGIHKEHTQFSKARLTCSLVVTLHNEGDNIRGEAGCWENAFKSLAQAVDKYRKSLENKIKILHAEISNSKSN